MLEHSGGGHSSLIGHAMKEPHGGIITSDPLISKCSKTLIKIFQEQYCIAGLANKLRYRNTS